MSYKKTTNKLFFKKYVYKVAIRSPLSMYFRGSTIAQVRIKLQQLDNQFSRAATTRIAVSPFYHKAYASVDDVLVMSKLLDIIEDIDDVKFRVEHQTLGLYFNNDNLTDDIMNIAGIFVEEFAGPADDASKLYLLNHPGVIIRAEYTHKYKVTIRSLWNDNIAFKEWAGNYDKIKLMPSNRYKFGGHFYVADDKMLSLCRLYLSDKITKIEELVTVSEIEPISNIA